MINVDYLIEMKEMQIETISIFPNKIRTNIQCSHSEPLQIQKNTAVGIIS